MKRLLRKLIVGLLTFVIGVSAYLVWYRDLYSVLHKYNTITVCDIDKNSRSYEGREIRLHASFERTKYYVFAMSPCGSEISGASIDLSPTEIAALPIPENAYSKDAKSQRVYFMDGIVIGQLEVLPGPACFAPKYHVKNAKVVQVNSIHEFENSDKAIEWLKSNSY